MPTRNEILEEIIPNPPTNQDIVRRKYLKDLSDYTHRNTILYATAFDTTKAQLHGMPSSLTSIVLEDIRAFMSAIQGLKGDNLDLILHSPGGSLETTEQLVKYLRAKFKHIRAIIPQSAMSAATMLACACDEIIMGKHSAIGPIDPQMLIHNADGAFSIPAQSILDEFEQAKIEVTTEPKLAALWINRINKYPHGFFKICRDTVDLAIEKTQEWLDEYMFKNSTITPKPGQEIASWLGKTGNHKTHGRPINKQVASDLGLKVIGLESDQRLQELVLSIFHSTIITFDITSCVKLVENQEGKGYYSVIQAAAK